MAASAAPFADTEDTVLTPSFGYPEEDFSLLELLEEVGPNGNIMELIEMDKRRNDNERDIFFVSICLTSNTLTQVSRFYRRLKQT